MNTVVCLHLSTQLVFIVQTRSKKAMATNNTYLVTPHCCLSSLLLRVSELGRRDDNRTPTSSSTIPGTANFVPWITTKIQTEGKSMAL